MAYFLQGGSTTAAHNFSVMLKSGKVHFVMGDHVVLKWTKGDGYSVDFLPDTLEKGQDDRVVTSPVFKQAFMDECLYCAFIPPVRGLEPREWPMFDIHMVEPGRFAFAFPTSISTDGTTDLFTGYWHKPNRESSAGQIAKLCDEVVASIVSVMTTPDFCEKVSGSCHWPL